MRLVISIDMDNAAFEDQPGTEAARILRGVCEVLEQNPTLKRGQVETLRDSNGNRVGTARIE